MFFHRSLQRFVAAGAILLVGGASLPEVVCCCNVSWGPGGLLGSGAECGEPGARVAGPKCPRCRSNAAAGEPTAMPQYTGKKCECRITLVTPAPMLVPVNIHVEQVGAGECCLQWHLPLVLVSNLSGTSGFEPPGDSLTPGARCAVLQNWRA